MIDAIADGWVPQSSGVLGSGSVGSTGVGDGTARSVLVSLELEGASVSGTVTSPSGSVLSGITVLAWVKVRHPTADDSLVPGGGTGPGTGQIRPYGRSFRTRTTTDSQGRYGCSGLPPGSLGVVAIKRKVAMTPQRFNATEGSSHTADFVIPD